MGRVRGQYKFHFKYIQQTAQTHIHVRDNPRMCIKWFYTTGPLNAWIWLADERCKQLFSGKRTVNVVPGTALHVHTTSPNDLRYFKDLYSLKQQKNQNPQRHWPNKYSKRKDKNNRSYPCFCHKMMFYVWKSTYSVSSSQTVCIQVNIHANIVSTTLTILSVTFNNLKTAWLLTSEKQQQHCSWRTCT